jgi:hypothetical protein
MRLFETGVTETTRLLVVVYHLVMDAVSWHIFVSDLQRAYTMRAGEAAERLPVRSASFVQWARHLNALAASESI